MKKKCEYSKNNAINQFFTTIKFFRLFKNVPLLITLLGKFYIILPHFVLTIPYLWWNKYMKTINVNINFADITFSSTICFFNSSGFFLCLCYLMLRIRLLQDQNLDKLLFYYNSLCLHKQKSRIRRASQGSSMCTLFFIKLE